MSARGGPPGSSEAGPRHRDRPTAETAAAVTPQVPDECPTSARQRQAWRALSAVSAGDAELFEFAAAHVDRALTRYPSLRGVDRAMYVGIVEQWMQPLNPGRLWLHRQWAAPRGEASWCGGVVGLHVPAPRGAA